MSEVLNMGMDVRKVVDELMKLQRDPINRMIQKKSDCHLKQTGYSNLENLLTKFAGSLDKLGQLFAANSYSVTSSNEAIVSAASSGSFLSAGDHTVNVIQCAQANQVTSGTFTSNNTALALSGTLTIAIGANSFSLSVVETDTLENVRDYINNALDNSGTTAAILSTTAVDGSTEYSLMLSSNDTGLANAMTFSGDLLPTFQFTNVISAAQDAMLTFDKFNVTRPSNTITDLMDGLELNLNGTIGGPVTIGIAANMSNKISTLVAGVQSVVDAYNDAMHGISYVQSKKGLLDGVYSWVQSGMSNAMRQTVGTGAVDSLLSIGVCTASPEERTNDEGATYVASGLTLDAGQLTQQLMNNYQLVNQLFTSTGTGLIASINNTLSGMDAAEGPIETRMTALIKQEAVLGQRVDNEENRLADVKQKLLVQYSKLNTVVQHYEQIAKYLESQMEALNYLNTH
ncbi:MAG: flagellar filament capping protein FliD [Legionellales bacterium]